MKILLLSDRIPPEHAGGAEVIAWNFARGLRDLGHNVTVLAATAGTPFEEVREGIETLHIHARWPMRLHAYFTLYHPVVARQVATVYDRFRPEVVATFNVHNGLTYHSLTLAHQRGIPVAAYFQDAMAVAYGKLSHFVDTAQATYTAESLRLPPLYNLKFARLRFNPLRNARIRHVLARHVKSRIAISEALKAALNINGIPVPHVVYPGQDESQWQSTPDQVQALRQRLGLSDKPVILLAGRLNPQKGSVQLLKALDLVRLHVPDVRLLLLTRSTPEQQGLMSSEFAHLIPHIVTGGWLEGTELAAAYLAADVITTPSVYLDPLIAVNQEAMVCRKPVVTTCFGGPPEVVVDGQTGYIVNPFDSETFANRLVHILRDPAHAAELGEAGYRRFRSHFVLQDRAAEMVEHYRIIL
jgi:glycosyltransferase involved in cell wall biosynthesis